MTQAAKKKKTKSATPKRRSSDLREKCLAEIVAAASKRADEKNSEFDIDLFVRHYYRSVAAEDLRERDPNNLAGAALAHLQFARRRKSATPLIRIYNPTLAADGWESTHTVIETVNDDMPFLVDSLGLVVARHGFSVQLTVHPIFRVQRSGGRLKSIMTSKDAPARTVPESFLRMEVNRETDPEALSALQAAIESSMRDVRAAIADWPEMRAKVISICTELEQNPPPLPPKVVTEGIAMMRWMENHHFTFLGYREYALRETDHGEALDAIPNTGLGILRGAPPSRKSRPPELARIIRKQVRSKELLIITKANSVSSVHRPGYLDYVGVKTYGEDGEVIGEKRFLGLFTSVAYSRSPRDIPQLRLKVQQVLERSGLDAHSHGGKALMHILDTYPRDELFQSSVEDLTRITEGVLNLQERQQVRLFIRRDAFRRFISCLVYVPRDKYNTQIRRRIENILREGFEGQTVDSNVQLSESNLARLTIIVRTPPESRIRLRLKEIQKRVVDAVRTWEDGLRDVLIERMGEETGVKLFNQLGRHFPAAYRDDVSPRAASFDLERLASFGGDDDDLRMSLYRPKDFPDTHLRFKIFRHGDPIPLSDVVPMLENMGMRVIGERPYAIMLPDLGKVWIHDFEMQSDSSEVIAPAEVNKLFQHAFANTWRGNADDDGFNRLVLAARLDWRQISLLRGYCRYVLQTGLPFSHKYMQEVLTAYPKIAKLLVNLFTSRFEPDVAPKRREQQSDKYEQELLAAVDSVRSADEDRIVRAFISVIRATLRTNYYQTGADGNSKPYISFKLDPSVVTELPDPRPMFEIFVYSPRVEGVHLRGGKVARGGIRWSDRREDFRAEVLGLMKAQKVKNTLIVPGGAKGGFVPKFLPAGDRDAMMKEVVFCYSTFIRGLLDITDNIVDGKIVSPEDVVRVDGDDPYLVVAADKGTATFSDTANGIAHSYGFWLGDAFASGGSAGYDHKKMGITAGGAWEAVKRHFRELGVDTQSQEFSVAGIGDMGGDVFGNGMLQSPHILLKAAFNHIHIFLDPDPDPQSSFAERERLFRMDRSTWDNYDRKAISAGGGVFSRQEKKIPLSAQIRTLLGVEKAELTPNELIRTILRMQVDLLWNGGIGTYVKAASETHEQASDRSNDAVRINGGELRCRVVGEGGNLGFTQRGRVEYAQKDGRINTDFIDNSGGVDCSDREVNIKILLNMAMQDGLKLKQRDRLLYDMTGEVGRLVLRNNYLQTQAISMAEAHAVERLREHAHFIRRLERDRQLDPELEFLPNTEEIEDRQKSGKGLTRPELAVLLSYGKISLYDALVSSDVPEDSYLATELARYFPVPLQRRYRAHMPQHRLAREIVATQITNSIINRMGPTFVRRVIEDTGASVGDVARAYTIALLAFDMRSLWEAIEALDNQVQTNVQYSMIQQSTRLLRHATYWLLGAQSGQLDIAASVSGFQPGIAIIMRRLPKLLTKTERKRFDETTDLYSDIGVPGDLARQLAKLPALYSSLDIVTVARDSRTDEAHVGGVYFRIGSGLRMTWLRDQIERLSVEDRWQAMARMSLRENLYFLQRDLCARVIRAYPDDPPGDAVTTWLEQNVHTVQRLQKTLDEMRMGGLLDFATLSVAIQEIRKLSRD